MLITLALIVLSLFGLAKFRTRIRESFLKRQRQNRVGVLKRILADTRFSLEDRDEAAKNLLAISPHSLNEAEDIYGFVLMHSPDENRKTEAGKLKMKYMLGFENDKKQPNASQLRIAK